MSASDQLVAKVLGIWLLPRKHAIHDAAPAINTLIIASDQSVGITDLPSGKTMAVKYKQSTDVRNYRTKNGAASTNHGRIEWKEWDDVLQVVARAPCMLETRY